VAAEQDWVGATQELLAVFAYCIVGEQIKQLASVQPVEEVHVWVGLTQAVLAVFAYGLALLVQSLQSASTKLVAALQD